MTINELPDVLRARRLEMGLTQDELCEMTGLARETISGFERRRIIPRLDTVDALLRALGLRLEVREG